MRKIYLILLIVLPLFLFSQGENNNWYFGDKAALNFSTANPTLINNSSMSAFESCGVVSDSNGNLLFYMNGETIWNRENQIMPNGVLLASGLNNSAQQLAIIKNPANSNQYYVFTTGENASASTNIRINYSIVDMTLGSIVNGSPLGDVVQSSKNIAVLDNLGHIFNSEAVTIVPNISDNSFWALIPNGTHLYSYRLSNTGFNNGNPVISNLNFPVNLDQFQFYGIKASTRLNNNNYSHYICVSYWSDKTSPNLPDSSFTNKVYSFNSITGQITNDFSLQVNGLRAYLPEFNKNSSVLFLGFKHIYAVDLVNSTSSSVQSMEIYHDPASSNPLGYGYSIGIQRNKFGDIYISRPVNSYLARVVNPDVYGSGMSVNLNAVNLGSGVTRYGLPQLLPIAEACIDNLVLTSESNISFNYEIGNKITTKDSYILNSRHNITMKAGGTVNLLPGTYIMEGAQYRAFIAPCNSSNVATLRQNVNRRAMVLELDKEERMKLDNNIIIFPNPVSDILTINSNTNVETVEVFDLSGRKINVSINHNKVDVKSLPSGTYTINIKTKSSMTSKQFIKK